MKINKSLIIGTFISAFILIGCDNEKSSLTNIGATTSTNTGSSSSTNYTPPPSTPVAVDVVAVDGYIKNALVKDSIGRIATYQNNGVYRFTAIPSYPLIVSGGQLEDTNATFDINLTAQSGSDVISPITTFLGTNSQLLTKISVALNMSAIIDNFEVDYVNTNNINLSKLSQLLYTILRDTTLTATFKNSVENNNTLDTLDKLFTIAENDINASSTLGSEEKIQSRALLTKIKAFNDTASLMEDFVKVPKQELNFLTVNGNPFITVWETNSTDSNITIPTNSGSYTYDYIVDWGDGNVTNNVTGDIAHTYATDGNHTVKIYGTFPAIYFNNGGDKTQINMITAWGDIKWQSMNSAFEGCSNLDGNSTDIPDLTNVTSMLSMFDYARTFNQNINNWDVSNVTTMVQVFWGATSFNQTLNNWNVSNVTSMYGIFNGATNFNQDISGWDVSNVTTMQYMFNDASSFTNQDLSGWNVGNITNHTDFMTGAGAGNTEPSW